MERIFVGIKLKYDAAARVSQQLATATTTIKGVQWIDDGNLHLTLKFIGEVPITQRNEIQSSLSNAALISPFEIKLAKVIGSPKPDAIRSIHVGLDRGESNVKKLKTLVDQSVLSILTTNEDDSTFHPHYTLGRVGQHADVDGMQSWIQSHTDYDGPAMLVDSFQLFKSTKASTYEVLAEYPLHKVSDEINELNRVVKGENNKIDSSSRSIMERIFIGIKLKPNVASSVSNQLYRSTSDKLNDDETKHHGDGSTQTTTTKMKGVKWIPDRNLHITLRFIGEVTREQRHDIETCLSQVSFSPFEMKLSRVGNFPKRGPVRIIHVGVDRGDLAVRVLKRKVDESLKSVLEALEKGNSKGKGKKGDEEGEEAFHSHVTIARVNYANNNEVKSWISKNVEYEGPEMSVVSFQLFKSTLTSSGSEYEVLAEYPLVGEEQGIAPQLVMAQDQEMVVAVVSPAIGVNDDSVSSLHDNDTPMAPVKSIKMKSEKKRTNEKLESSQVKDVSKPILVDMIDEAQGKAIVNIPKEIGDNSRSKNIMERVFIGIKLTPGVASSVSNQLFRNQEICSVQDDKVDVIDTREGETTRTSSAIITSTQTTTTKMKGVKWIPDRNLHITLRFIGEVTREQRHDIETCLSQVSFSPFEMKLSRVGNFPKRGPVRIIHVGVDRGDLAVRVLKRKVDESLKSVLEALEKGNSKGKGKKGDEEGEEAFHSHVTIARVNYANNNEVKSWISKNVEYEGPEMSVVSFQLFKSTLTSSGSEYEVLAEYPLVGEDPL